MINRWLPASEIAIFTASDKRVINRRAVNEHWPSRNEKANGGTRRVYQARALPEDILTAYAVSLKLALTELQSRLKPSSKHEKKIDIPRYNGRGAKTKAVKPLEGTADTALKIAAARRKLIEAFNASGLPVPQFITAYENGVAAPELREQLGRYGNIHTQSNFYEWLARYGRHGLAGLAPQYGLGAVPARHWTAGRKK
ncbi:MAG: hypothetical protein LBG43_08720 [Treponema sp.]|jgi:hypothetical protein|nr:hypothetical protein [Treponema sp.]